jgi:sn-glycerol 3-phosphate transport system substrate-binding protein
MADAKEPFDPKAYIGPVYGYYSTTDGKLLSMPFNSSTPVLYWNKDLLAKAGLDPNKPPKTWPELGEMAKKAVAAGAKCGFTPQWQTWTMIENYGAWHNLPYATKENGFRRHRRGAEVQRRPRVKFIQMLADWSKDKTFVYGGREGKSTALFTAGDCVFHIASSATASAIDKALGTEKFGIAMMPYSPDVRAKPQNSIIGGATCGCCRASPRPSMSASRSS